MQNRFSLWAACAVLMVGVTLAAEEPPPAAAAPDSAPVPAPAPAPTVEERLARLEAASSQRKDDLQVVWDNGLKFRSSDNGKTFNLNVGGRLQWDLYFVAQTARLKRALGAAAAATNTDAVAFRRLRLELAGTMYERMLFKIEVEFAGGAVAVRDAFVGVKYGARESVCAGTLRIGSIAEMGMLNRATNDCFHTFLERPMLVAFHPDWSSGIWTDGGYRVDGVERMTWALGVFRDVGASGNDVGAGRNGKYNGSLRLTCLPLYDDGKISGSRKLFHLGGMLSQRNPNTFTAGIQTVAYGARPDTNFGPLLVSTGNVQAAEVRLFGLELAGVVDRFWIDAEYVGLATRKPSGLAGADASFNGYYVSAGLFLTGESRSYKTATGAWDRIKPLHNAFASDAAGAGGLGAWEIAARYDVLDLEDHPAAVYGGELTAVTGALNWYPNPNMRAMFNYTYVDLQQRLAVSPRNTGTEQIATFRLQVDL